MLSQYADVHSEFSYWSFWRLPPCLLHWQLRLTNLRQMYKLFKWIKLLLKEAGAAIAGASPSSVPTGQLWCRVGGMEPSRLCLLGLYFTNGATCPPNLNLTYSPTSLNFIFKKLLETNQIKSKQNNNNKPSPLQKKNPKKKTDCSADPSLI